MGPSWARVAIVGAAFAVPACGRIGFDFLGLGPADAPAGGSADGAVDGIADGHVDAPADSPLDAAGILSCVGLTETCGSAGTDACCRSAVVPGETYFRSYDLGADGMFADMSKPATVSAVRLDVYEVTVGRFRQFVTAGMGTQASTPASGAGARTLNATTNQGGWDPTWNASLAADSTALVAALKCNGTYQSWTDAPGANESLPINCVTWFDAFAFCVWDGGFLPTEAEWNNAAAAGSEQRAYPWSNPASSTTIDCTYANFKIASPCVNPPNGSVDRVGSQSPTGDGKYGHADLAGNVWEWNLDFSNTTYPAPCSDCADLASGTNRALRGGDFLGISDYQRGAYRFSDVPTDRSSVVGIRCARTP